MAEVTETETQIRQEIEDTLVHLLPCSITCQQCERETEFDTCNYKDRAVTPLVEGDDDDGKFLYCPNEMCLNNEQKYI
jgi:hypothetical protein